MLHKMKKIYFVTFLMTTFFIYSQNSDVVLKIDGKTLDINKNNSLEIYQEFYDSGRLKVSGYKKDGKFEGLFEYYDENQKIINRILYKKNRILYTNFVGHKNGFFTVIKSDSLNEE
tara:strand:- start:24 stop:371 length:348 start_codon:yes stop_codon:yes gene_type:complete